MRLIDADLAVAKCNEDIEAVKDLPQRQDGILDAIMNIHECPTVDAVPVKHGKWLKIYHDHVSFGVRPFSLYCSECSQTTVFQFNFCPNCGARMEQT